MTKRFGGSGRSAGGRRSGSLLGVLFVAVLSGTVLLANLAFAGGFALSGVGSKAIAMGGAFRGLADDWSAVYWNPAGLTQLEESELNSMLVAITPRPEYAPDITYGGLDVGYRNGDVRYPNDETTFIPDFSGFFKFQGFENYTVGLGIFVPVGLNSKWDLYNPTAPMDIRNQFPEYDHGAKLSVIDIHPTVARSFMDGKLSLGAGLSIQRASVEFHKTILKPSGLPVPHQNILIDSYIEGDGWGYGANFGLLYRHSDKLQFGISGRTGSTLKHEGTAKLELYTMDNVSLRDILLGNSYTSEDTQQILLLFSDQNWISEPSAKADIKIPADIGFGVAVKPNDKLTLSGEVAITYWSALDSIAIELTGTDPTGQEAENSVIVLNWDNITRFSVGAEYWVAEPFAIRLGYYLDPSPIPDETFSPLIPDMGDKNSINIGAALKFRDLEFAYNYEYISFGDRVIKTLEDANGDGIFDNYPGEYKSSLHASHFSLTYRF